MHNIWSCLNEYQKKDFILRLNIFFKGVNINREMLVKTSLRIPQNASVCAGCAVCCTQHRDLRLFGTTTCRVGGRTRTSVRHLGTTPKATIAGQAGAMPKMILTRCFHDESNSHGRNSAILNSATACMKLIHLYSINITGQQAKCHTEFNSLFQRRKCPISKNEKARNYSLVVD